MTEVSKPESEIQSAKLVRALRDSLKEVRRLEAANAELSATAAGQSQVDDDPVVVVAASCRFPGGVRSPEQLWTLVESRTDATAEFPNDRGWNLDEIVDASGTRPHTSYVGRGGFLSTATLFDPAFFGISPREAAAMDPQQRILLELAWEAFERARIDPRSRRGTDVGVWIGTNGQDYLDVLQSAPDAAAGYVGTGSASSVLSGRLSYVFGLTGPSVTIDTACSASLVAMHEAAAALRSGECNAALVGGVTVMATPRAFVDFSTQRGLAPDGRCKAFGAGADGTAWGEGAGMLLMQRLSDARAEGRDVLAVLAGSAVGSDGASAGLTAPNGTSQQRVIRSALSAAGLGPADVDVVEAHGTGTALGDPIEARALLATYGVDRGERGPLYIGSVKSNIGHTQAAAGVAGVIKMIMAMRAGTIPATLHADTPTESVDWSTGGVTLAVRNHHWNTPDGGPRRSAVSSFGFSGTNAHVILSQGDPVGDAVDTSPATDRVVALPLSARSAAGLTRVAHALADRIESLAAGESAADVAVSAAHTRAALAHRAVVAFDSGRPDDAVARLRALGAEESPAGTVRGVADSGRTVAMFTGQGSVSLGMGRELYQNIPVYRAALDEILAELDRHLPAPLTSVMWGDDPQLLARTEWAQPALFAVEVAAYRLAESVGVRIDALIGHSVGECSAIHVSGALSLGDAALLVTTRGRAMGNLPAGGGMWTVRMGEDEVRAHLVGSVGLAAVNAPDSVVISGSAVDAEPVLASLRAEGHDPRPLEVSHAFHSVLMAPMLDELAAAVRRISAREPDVTIVSTVTGEPLHASTIADPDYWTDQVSRPVRFADAVRTAAAVPGTQTYLELGPAAVLAPLTQRILRSASDLTVLSISRRGMRELESTVCALAGAWTRGADLDWSALIGTGKTVDLPTYPFEAERYWLDSAPAVPLGPGLDAEGASHPLVDTVVDVSDRDISVSTGRLSPTRPRWLADHRVHGAVVVPGTAIVDLALHAGRRVGTSHLAELALAIPIVVSDSGIELQVIVAEEIGRRRNVTVSSRQSGADDWTVHAKGVLAVAETALVGDAPTTSGPTDEIFLTTLYEDLGTSGLVYGPSFRGARTAHSVSGSVRVEVVGGVGRSGFVIDPALLDSALHTIGFTAAVPDGELGRVPFSWTDVSVHVAAAAGPLTVILTPVGDSAVSMHVSDAMGRTVATVGSVTLLPISTVAVAPPLHRIDWVAPAAPSAATDVDLAAVSVADYTNSRMPDDPAMASTVVSSALQEICEHLDRLSEHDPLIVAVTTGSVTGAAVAGLARSAATENPGRVAVLEVEDRVAMDGALTEAIITITDTGESWLRVHATGELSVPRVRRISPSTPPEASSARRSTLATGTVLITGATGTLGSLVAEHIVARHGVRSLALLGRRERTDDSESLDAALAEAGVRVRRYACDVTDREDLRRVVDDIDDLTGVVHAAGVTQDGVVTALDAESIDTVLAPKLTAAVLLHELTRTMDLAAFVVFSSIAGVVGAAGQGNYAAANSGLDALVAARRVAGLPGLSLAWGVWARSSSLTADLTDADRQRMRRSGMAPLTTEAGLALFDAALVDANGVVVAATFDRSRPVAEVPLVLSAVLRADTNFPDVGGPESTPTVTWTELGLRELVTDTVATVLGTASDEVTVTPGVVFRDLGFDSLLSVELRNSLARATGLTLPASLVFDHPTVDAMTEHLTSLLGISEENSIQDEPNIVRPQGEDPVVIVGMSCRFPGGVRTPEDLWTLLDSGTDAVGGFPDNRGWNVETLFDPDPDAVGHTYTDQGGFLYDADEFDPNFFGITPREAVTLDPQQRLLLEASWEAVENGGLDPNALRGSNTGVFVGMMYHDYGTSVADPPPELEGYLANGSAGSVASGRIAYTFGFEGPTLTVDTACSSSLVTTHLAAAAIAAGECDVALAGGVTVMATPQTFVEFSRQRGLAPDGRCKSFSASADGTGWGEGVGMLVLTRRSIAQARGVRELAVLRGSAVNQDGASNGLTAPNGPSQQRVINRALASAGLTGADVDMVEAHGTGTTLGDPIEAGALLATYGRARPVEDPIRIGSLKSNIGHAQAAAGVGGIIKCVLAMQHGSMPRTLHVDALSPGVDWSSGSVSVLAEAQSWPAYGRPRRAAVSAFGISGTNAHVILEAPAAESITNTTDSGPVIATPSVVVVSARVADSIVLSARALADRVRDRALAVADVAHTLRRRGLHHHRAAVIAGTSEELYEGLIRLANGTPAGTEIIREKGDLGRIGAAFSGQGTQRPGMAAELASASPGFGAELDVVIDALDRHLHTPLRSLLWPDESGTDAARLLERTEFAQPALFAVEVALHRHLEARGWHTDAVVGHSIGEYAAAHVAGVFDLGDAARLVCARAAAMQACPTGAMVAVTAPADAVREVVGSTVDIAAVNGPTSTVISGSSAATETAATALVAAGFTVRKLLVSHGFHSSEMQGACESFADAARTVRYREPVLPFFSTSTGRRESSLLTSPEYWVDQIRRPVLFDTATRALLAHGVRTTVEFGPGAVLSALGREIADDAEIDSSWIPLLRNGIPESQSVASATATLVVRGASPRVLDDESAGHHAAVIDLPGHPFRRDRFWLAGRAVSAERRGASGVDATDHCLLDASMTVAGQSATVYTGRLDPAVHRWLNDHTVSGVVVVPATVLLELVHAVGTVVDADTVVEMSVETPLELPGEGGRDVQVVRTDADPQLTVGEYSVRVFSRPVSGGEWVSHANAVVGRSAPVSVGDHETVSTAEGEELRVDYDVLADRGLEYGPAFRGAGVVRAAGGELVARVELPEFVDGGDYAIHPALLDACLHALSITDEGDRARIPFLWSGVRYLGNGRKGTVRLKDVGAGDTDDFAEVSVRFSDDDGRDLVVIDRLSTRRLDPRRVNSRAARARLRVLSRVPVTLSSADAPAVMSTLTEPVPKGDGSAVGSVMLLDARPATSTGPVRSALAAVVDAVRGWLESPETVESTLVVLNHRALGGGRDAADPCAAAVFAALSSAQSENPGRMVLIDVEDPDAAPESFCTSRPPRPHSRNRVWWRVSTDGRHLG